MYKKKNEVKPDVKLHSYMYEETKNHTHFLRRTNPFANIIYFSYLWGKFDFVLRPIFLIELKILTDCVCVSVTQEICAFN